VTSDQVAGVWLVVIIVGVWLSIGGANVVYGVMTAIEDALSGVGRHKQSQPSAVITRYWKAQSRITGQPQITWRLKASSVLSG
jgi:hypothetical protein